MIMLEVIVLAAGRGTRMRSSLPKVLHTLAGKPMIRHVLDTARRVAAKKLHVVVGHGAEQVCQAVAADDVTTYVQPEQLGTGHATLAASPHCQEDSVLSYPAVFKYAVRFYDCTSANTHITFDHNIDIDRHIFSTIELAS